MHSRSRLGRTLSRFSCLALAAVLALLLSTSMASAAADMENGAYAEVDDSEGDVHQGDWEYDPYYVFPLTRHMPDSELPMAGQIALYPVAFVIDLIQWPIGALAGLAGK